MDNFNEYINSYSSTIKSISNATYKGAIQSSSVVFSFDYKEPIHEVCFARLYSLMSSYERKFSSNYFMRLPYSINDENPELHTDCVDYNNFFTEIQKLVFDTYDVTLYNTKCNNVKLVTMVDKIEMPFNLHYCLTLVLYTLLRGVEGEYIPHLRLYFNKNILTGDLKEYIYKMSKLSRGSHHNVNDVLDKLVKKNNISEDNKKSIFESYIDTLNITFGKDGLIHNHNYIKYFKEVFVKQPDGYGSAMQTKCYDYINKATNKTLLESLS